ncbi:MAG TPA: glycosyl transferase family 28, partial [Flavisolibacter sp.]|nr:glycosyl transferase family 28 [Flavisolibacter sp.]
MDSVKITSKPVVLVAPLDWGLGHTTRCIPIIKELLNQDYPVILAGDERTKTIYNTEFPRVPFIYLKGYNISYSAFKFLLPVKLAMQIPLILKTIRYEHKWLKKIIAENHVKIVISDNRFGLYNKEIKSIFITHQLAIKTSLGFKTDAFIQKLNYSYINQFNKCWIPDTQSTPSLAGELSHPFNEPSIPVHYLGALSRFKKEGITNEKKHLLFLLSGPEPQRSQLEKMLLYQSQNYNG